MTIGALAKRVGVHTWAVRFDERAGLLRPERRTFGNYCDSMDVSLERLRFVGAAQAVWG